MKKLFALLAIVAFLLPSCQKINDRLDAIDNRLDNIEGTQIASLQQQIDAINTTLPELKQMDAELKEYISNLQTTAAVLDEKIEDANDDIKELENALDEAIDDAEASNDVLKEELISQLNTAKADVLAQLQSTKTALEAELALINSTIATLQTKDAELEQKITALEEYVNSELKNTEDWASATFATLEQYNSVCDEIATIKQNIESITTSVTELEERLNTKIASDIATAVSTLDATIQTKVTEITTAYTTAISTAKEEITAAYTEAIATSIANLESSMKEWVNEQLTGYYTIAETDALLVALQKELEGQLAAQKGYLEELISNLSTELNSQIETLRSDLATAEGNIAENANNIADNASKILANSEAIAANSDDIANNEQLIANNKSLIEENATLIEENKGAITDADKKIAKNAETIAENAALIAQNATAINNNAQAVADNAAAIAQLRNDLASTKEELTEAYTEAIASAINTNNGVLRDEVAKEVATINARIDEEIDTINTTIATLTERVTTLENEITAIQDQIADLIGEIDNMKEDIANLLSRIQSISYIPTYSDGKVSVDYVADISQLSIDFEVSPKDAVIDLAKVWQDAVSLKAVYTQTRSISFVDMPIVSFESDATNGIISIVASGENLSEDFFTGSLEASVSLSISDGNNTFITDYLNLKANQVSLNKFTPPTNEIWYITTDEMVVAPRNSSRFGANLVSNIYENGRGVITFDNSITTIPAQAFFDENTLSDISLPASIHTINGEAFYNTSITSFVVPDSVEAITGNPLSCCKMLRNVYGKFTLDNNRIVVGNKLICVCCTGLEEYTIPQDIEIIGSGAFKYSTINKVVIPSHVKIIEVSAFRGCSNMSEVKLNYGLEQISNDAFYGAGINGTLIIPESVTYIGNGAFEYTQCKEIIFPQNLETISSFICNGSNVENITLPLNVKEIQHSAFYGTSIKEIHIPATIKKIGRDAFASWQLNNVYCAAINPPSIDVPVFDDEGIDENELITIFVPSESVDAYKSADGWSKYADYIVGYDFTE